MLIIKRNVDPLLDCNVLAGDVSEEHVISIFRNVGNHL
jgi:hypothetical protein